MTESKDVRVTNTGRSNIVATGWGSGLNLDIPPGTAAIGWFRSVWLGDGGTCTVERHERPIVRRKRVRDEDVDKACQTLQRLQDRILDEQPEHK